MSILDAALEWADAGIAVFPCGTNKRPLTTNGFKDASTDPVKIKEMFEFNGECYIGGRMGATCGMFAVDFDLYKGSEPQNYMKSLQDKGLLPETRMHETKNGGLHAFYSHDTTWPNVVPASGIEIKGEGSYVILPPSDGYKVLQEGVVNAPDGLINVLMQAKITNAAQSIDDLKMKIIKAEEFHDSLRLISARRSAAGWDVTKIMTELLDTLHASMAKRDDHPRFERWLSLSKDVDGELTRIVSTGSKKYNVNAASDEFRDATADAAKEWEKAADAAGFMSSRPVGKDSVKTVEDYGDAWPFEGSGYFAHQDHDLLNQTYVMHPFFAEEETTVLFAEPKMGKTAWNVTASFYIACGMDFGPNLKVTEARPCLYYALEGSRAIKLRIQALRRQLTDDGVELPDEIPLFIVEQPANFLKEETRLEACNQIIAANNYCIKHTGKGLGVISLDTLTKAMSSGDQNSVEDTSALFELVGLLREAGVTASIVFVHHKARTGGVRGSTNIEAEPDVLLDVSKRDSDIVVRVARARSIEEGGEYSFGTKGYALGKTLQGIDLSSFTVYPKEATDEATVSAEGLAHSTKQAQILNVIIAMPPGHLPLKAVFDALEAEGLAPSSGARRKRKPGMTAKYVQDFFKDVIGLKGRVYSQYAISLAMDGDDATHVKLVKV